MVNELYWTSELGAYPPAESNSIRSNRINPIRSFPKKSVMLHFGRICAPDWEGTHPKQRRCCRHRLYHNNPKVSLVVLLYPPEASNCSVQPNFSPWCRTRRLRHKGKGAGRTPQWMTDSFPEKQTYRSPL